MCFNPTMEQFKNFSKFIDFMESNGAHKCGVAKVSADTALLYTFHTRFSKRVLI